MKLKEALQQIPSWALKAIASWYRLRLPPGPHSVPLIVEALAQHLTTPAVIERILSELSPQERAALDTLIAEGGRLPKPLFTRDYGDMTSFPSFLYSSGSMNDQLSIRSPANSLVARGLIVRGYGRIGEWHGEIVEIPDDLLPLLPSVTKPPFRQLLTTVQPPIHIIERGDLVRDICLFLCYLDRETVRAVRGNLLPKRDLKTLNDDFSLQHDMADVRSESDVPRIAFVHYLASLLQLVTIHGGIFSLTDKAASWLRKPYDEQTWDVWRHYQQDANWNELEESTLEHRLSCPPQFIIGLRNCFLEILKRCPIGHWLSEASLETAVKTHASGFLRTPPKGTVQPWLWSELYGGWDVVEGPYIRKMLSTTLNWFGVVDVGLVSREGQNLAFRITDTGAILLGMSRAKLPQAVSRPIVVQANFEIIVPTEASPGVLFEVQHLAELRKRDKASIYALTPDSIWHCLQNGMHIERIIAFLEQASQQPLPQNVAYSLRDWAARFGEITIDQVVLLKTANAALLAALQADKKVGPEVTEALSPQAVALARQDIAALTTRLRRRGYWPKLCNDLAPNGQVRETDNVSQIEGVDLMRLLAAALVLSIIAENEGWTPPVSQTSVRQLSWRLPPALVKEMARLVTEAIAVRKAMIGNPAESGAEGKL